MDSFTGKPDQIAGDEYDFKAREMHDGQGRWISPDPVDGTGNKYVYADNNPLSSVDIYGFSTIVLNGMEESSQLPAERAAFLLVESHGQFSEQTDSTFIGTPDQHAGSSPTASQPAAQQQQAQAQQSQQQGQPAQQAQQHSCGFWCRLFHRDHVPYKMVIKPHETEKMGSYSKFHYVLENKEGQKLTGNYGVEEHLWSNQQATHHMLIGHNSENVYAPQNSHGEYIDRVGYYPQLPGQASFDVYQTFSVSHNGTITSLDTEFEHITVVTGNNYSNDVVVISP